MPRTLDDLTWPVRTEQLLIRPVTPEDAPAVWRYRQLPDVYGWITTAPRDEQAFSDYFLEAHR